MDSDHGPLRKLISDRERFEPFEALSGRLRKFPARHTLADKQVLPVPEDHAKRN